MPIRPQEVQFLPNLLVGLNFHFCAPINVKSKGRGEGVRGEVWSDEEHLCFVKWRKYQVHCPFFFDFKHFLLLYA